MLLLLLFLSLRVAQVASFLEDMVHDATEDFLNYLTFRCEYLHDYARASPRHALEVIKCIMHTSHPKNAHDSVRPDRLAKLVVAMVEMNARFFHQLFYKYDTTSLSQTTFPKRTQSQLTHLSKLCLFFFIRRITFYWGLLKIVRLLCDVTDWTWSYKSTLSGVDAVQAGSTQKM